MLFTSMPNQSGQIPVGTIAQVRAMAAREPIRMAMVGQASGGDTFSRASSLLLSAFCIAPVSCGAFYQCYRNRIDR